MIIYNGVLCENIDELESLMSANNLAEDQKEILRNDFLGNPNSSNLTPLQQLEIASKEIIDFGTSLFLVIKRKIWAKNVYNENLGNPLSTQDMLSLFQVSDTLQKALEGGSLKTARIICQQLKVSMPQYSDVADFAINSINSKIGAP